MVSSIARGLQPSFYWPGSGGGSAASAGESQAGNLRSAVTGNTIVVGGFGNGFVGLNENHESLHHIGSTWTGMLGHSSMVDHGGGIGNAPFAARWLVQSGGSAITSSLSFGALTVTFPVLYSGIPFVAIPPIINQNNGNQIIVQLSNVTQGGFTSFYSLTVASGTGSSFTLTWESDGTVAR